MAPARIEVIPYALPFREPYVTARGTLESREIALLRVTTADGAVGHGEAVPLSLRGGASLADVVSQLEEVGGLLVEAGSWTIPAGDAPLRKALHRLSPPAACALITARLDVEARQKGVPAWRALAASRAEPVTCNATLVAGSPAQTAERAERWAADGFRTFKLKAGTGADAEAVRAVRAAIGEHARIRLDANGSWSVSDARRILEECEPAGIELVEQPVGTLRKLAKLRRATAIPIAGDESVAAPGDADRALELEACDLATIKLSKVGGHLDAIWIAEKLPVYLSSALDGPVGIAAAAHVAQALRERELDASLAHGLATQRLFSSTIAQVECELRGDQLSVPDGPGLGVEIDDAALERHRL
jgi:muconate cycloisomerase